MNNWFVSLHGAMVLSSLAMLSFIGYTLLEFRYFLESWIPGVKAATLEMLFVLVLVGCWQIALFTAYGGKKSGMVGLMIIAVIPAVITLFDLIFYSPIPYGWPLLQIMVCVTLITSSAAIASTAFQLK